MGGPCWEPLAHPAGGWVRGARAVVGFSAALALAVSGGTAWADPADPGPVGGASPAPSADGSSTAITGSAPAASASVVARVRAAETAAEAVAERLDEAKVDLAVSVAARSAAADQLAEETARVRTARAAVASVARQSYIAAAGRPAGLPTDPRNEMFGHSDPQVDTARLVLDEAEARQLAATEALFDATSRVAIQREQVDLLKRDLTARGTALRALRAGQAAVLAAARQQHEATDAAMSSQYVRDARGVAGNAALKAVAFALAQRGKPYEWGAEGPDRYDCSGLVQTAYATAGVSLPRTARPQYRMTQAVAVTALLPGDLLFFATDPADWNTIHHVGIYLGHGLMLHAPTTGDVVRIAPVWWSEFFAATRVVPGSVTATVPMPSATRPAPVKSPTPTPTPTPTSTVTPSASPSPSPTGSSSPSAVASSTGAPSPTPSSSAPGSSAASSPVGSPTRTDSPAAGSPGAGSPAAIKPTETRTAAPTESASATPRGTASTSAS